MQRDQQAGSAKRTSFYQEITDRIVAELEQGRVPWVQPWGAVKTALGLPQNAATGRSYTGINILILWDAAIARGFAANQWLTYRQALGLGGHVGAGERGTTVFYADRFVPHAERERAAEAGDEPEAIPFLKRFTVFNVTQCDGLPERARGNTPTRTEQDIVPEAEALIGATGADFRIGSDEAVYFPSGDFIRVPPQAAFFQPIDYYRTCFHELGHNADTRIMPRRAEFLRET